jgi:RNA polymerase sigma factor (sigma-70 family)
MVDIFKSVASLTIRTQAGFLAWATRVVRNRVAQVHRRNLAQRRGGGERHLPLDPADGQELIDGLFRHSRSPRSWLANKELLGLLPLWVDSLEEPARRVIRMKFVDDRDYQTIAVELKKTPQAVRMMVMRSLRQLRAMAIVGGEEVLP